jgi:hypothetical protein
MFADINVRTIDSTFNGYAGSAPCSTTLADASATDARGSPFRREKDGRGRIR